MQDVSTPPATKTSHRLAGPIIVVALNAMFAIRATSDTGRAICITIALFYVGATLATWNTSSERIAARQATMTRPEFGSKTWQRRFMVGLALFGFAIVGVAIATGS